MRDSRRDMVVVAWLAVLVLITPAWSAPISSEDLPKHQATPAGTAGTAGTAGLSESKSSASLSSKEHVTTTGDKSMDLLLQAKMPGSQPDLDANQAGTSTSDPLATQSTPSGATKGAPGRTPDGEVASGALKSWMRDVGGSGGEGRSASPTRTDGDREDESRGGGQASRSHTTGEHTTEAEPSAFGRAIAFIRENRVVMLMVCGLVLILAGAAFVYSSKGSSGSRRLNG